ncbi:MAG TPA: hypothetical protein VJS66_09190 [Burkholderiales bacterium]|nr:hypothetical protein [Burkholderiales bacterium]
MSMKTLFRSFVILVSPMLVATVLAAPPASFGQLVDNLDPRKNTKLHAKEYWKNVKGSEVSWTGEVVDVDSNGSSKAKIYVADKSRPLYKGYNIVVITGDIAKASTVKKGNKLRFKGLLDDYDQKDAGAVVEIKEAMLQ